MKSILEFNKKKQSKEKITFLTCYDYLSAKALESTSIDGILVGDSAAMVVHGYESTLHATTEMMATHVSAVSRGAKGKFIVADMPFLSYRKDLITGMNAVEKLMVAGAHAVKLEGVWGCEELIKNIVLSGVPVMGHIGLTPQSIHQIGGYRVQGRSETTADDLVAQALKLQELGCFSLVVECVPKQLGQHISNSLQIPVIGIGAGSQTDGQVLVLHDMLGLAGNSGFTFVRQYAAVASIIKEAVESYCNDVRQGTFPTDKESFS